jgi:hypothetical protein
MNMANNILAFFVVVVVLFFFFGTGFELGTLALYHLSHTQPHYSIFMKTVLIPSDSGKHLRILRGLWLL